MDQAQVFSTKGGDVGSDNINDVYWAVSRKGFLEGGRHGRGNRWFSFFVAMLLAYIVR